MRIQSIYQTLTAVLVSGFLLVACGGGSDNKPLQQSNDTGDNVSSAPLTPQQPNLISHVPKVVEFSYQTRYRFARLEEGQVVDDVMINGTGDLIHPTDTITERGNLTVSVENIEDPDGISRVLIGFNDTEQAIVLCESNCSTPFKFTQTGINPFNFGQARGSINIQVWVEDLSGNVTVVATKQVNWLPRSVVVEPTQRSEDGTVSVSWQPLDEALRYNVYLAQSPINTLSSVTALPDGRRVIALTETNQDFTGLDAQKHYYLRVTGIDGSGESAFSDSIMLPATELIFPVANNDSFTGAQFQAVSGNVLSNDQDLGFGPLQVVLPVQVSPQNGELNLQSNGNFTYTPKESFFGSDSFVYQVINTQGATAQATVSINIERTNQNPMALPNSYALQKNSELSISGGGLLVNDIDFDGDSVSVNTTPVVDVQNGTLTLNSDGTFTYVPTADFVGSDFFEYRIEDGNGGFATADVSISIEEELTNTPPTAVNDNYQTSEDILLQISAPGILDNDTDDQLDSGSTDLINLQIEIAETTKNGALELTSEGGFRYTPGENFSGQDFFVYQVSDLQGATATAFALIDIVPVNDPPMALDDSVEVTAGAQIEIDVANNDLDIDGVLDLSTLSVVMEPMHGSLSLNSANKFVYQSESGFDGTDYFTYTVKDNEGAVSNEAFVYIFVTTENIPPVAANDAASTTQDTAVEINVLANDSDPDGSLNGVSLEIVTSPKNGSTSINTSDHVVTYLPESGFVGIDTFEYRVQDNRGDFSNTAIVTVSVSEANQPPVANNDSAEVEIGSSVFISVLENDTDEDGLIDFSTLELVASPSKGTVSLGSTGSFTYQHTGTAVGTDSFSYQVKDNAGALSNIALVSITIVEPDTTPIANPDSATLDKNTSVMIDVLANDNAKGLALVPSTVEIITPVGHGSTFIDSLTGTVSYIPMNNFVGNDSFTYQVSNNASQTSNVATVSIVVNNKNYAPNVSGNSANIQTNVSNGDLVLQVSASDPDGDDISFSLTGVNAALFAIAQDGRVTVANATQIASNGATTYALTVEVCDSVSPPLCSSASITINVTVAQTIFVANKLTTFGSDGEKVVRLRASMEYHEVGQSIVLSDGKVLVVGGVGTWVESISRNIHRAVVTKLMPDGYPDTSFANQGVFESYFGIEVSDQPQNIVAKVVAVDSENRIYVAGYADFGSTEAQELLLFRLNSDGSHDTTYGAGSGYTKLPLTTGARITPVAIMVDDSQTVTVLSDVKIGENTTISLTRVDSSGGISGSLDLAPGSSQYADGFVDLGTHLLVYGEVMSEAGNKDLLFARVNKSTLLLDTSFQSSGFLQIDIYSASFDNQVHDVVQLSDGKILLTGDSYLTGGSDKSVFVMRLDSDGNMDTTFNTSGYILYELNQLPASGIEGQDFSTWNAYGFGIFADDSHYYVGIGRGLSSSSSNAAQLIRTDHNGVIDSAWLPDSGGPTAYRQFLLAPVDLHRTAQGLLMYGYQYRSVGNNFFYSLWLGEFTLDAQLNSNFGSSGQVDLDTGSDNETFATGQGALSTSNQLFISGYTTTWQDGEVPYIYKLDDTGKGVSAFGGLGKAQFALSNSGTTTAMVETAAGNLLLAGNQNTSQAFIVNMTNAGVQDFDFIPGSSGSAISINAGEYGGTGSTIAITKLYSLATGDFLAFAKINDGCIDQSHAFIYSNVGIMSGHFQYPVPSGVSCGTTARGIDFIHPVSTFLIGIGTDEQEFTEPRVILAKATVTGVLDPTFGTAGVAALDIGLVSGETLTLKGSFVDGEGRFVIFGTGGTKNFVVRVNSDGTLDTTFGASGVLIFEQLGTTAVAVKQGWAQSTGELVMFLQATSGLDVYVARVKLDEEPGTFDLSFNSVGYQQFSATMTGQLESAISLNNGNSFVLVLQQDEPKVIVLQAGKIEVSD
ncbi:Ig-like domain-containing protein [Pseudoalteromonas sp. SMS1]|uniref:Ig-like domain-containing protein n=1 Tax=Pseudoalteromonas sp. SMS1 TaxID=2908894 RepID=UPI001F236A3C|nr:Ig-like domain-containing protein [Pseudoalteromonas sp. SMS1]MCF2858115.1 Ig-like domain-containing protein [Pseudoalteromonas sp. SMS1]